MIDGESSKAELLQSSKCSSGFLTDDSLSFGAFSLESSPVFVLKQEGDWCYFHVNVVLL